MAAHPALICIPHAGAGASVFAQWRLQWGPGCLPIALPGRESLSGQQPLQSIERMAQHCAGLIAGQRMAGAILYGHSMGGLVAYETARLLQASHPGALARLVVSGCRAPTSPLPFKLSALSDDAAFLQAMAELGGIGQQWIQEPELQRYVLPILRADVRAMDAYRHEPAERLNLPLWVLGGDDDPWVPAQELVQWRGVTDGPFEMRVFAGGHFFIHQHAAIVLGLLRLAGEPAARLADQPG